MLREYVESTNIASVGYDSCSAILEVEFIGNGSVYEYYDVPEYVWQELMSAGSIGSYFHKNIRNVYSFNRIQ